VSVDEATGPRLLRRFLLGSGPLKRSSDRLQVLARVLLVSLVLAAVPIALAVATATGSQTRAVADAQAASRHRVTATLVEDAGPPTDRGEYALPVVAVSATWAAPSGAARHGIIDAPARLRAGSIVRIWVDAHGDVTTRPLDDSDVVARAVFHSVTTFLCVTGVAALGYVGSRRAIDRSRMRRWAADWAVVEPVWSRTVR
jgi:hypothetical protein